MSRISIRFSAKPGPHQVGFLKFDNLLQDVLRDYLYEYGLYGMAKVIVGVHL